MAANEPQDDFRSNRRKLPPEAFAIAPEREPDPSDLIDPSTWSAISTLPDDVSLRTSDHHGTTVRQAYDLWGHWTGLVLDVQSLATDPREDALALACLNVTDELQASIYAALTGFYRQAIAGLRSALEGMMVGVYFRAFPDQEQFTLWADGHRGGRLWWRRMREKLVRADPYVLFEGPSEEIPLLGDSGWINFLYDRLSGFSHGRPLYTDEDGNQVPTSNVGLWGGSNGPVYESSSVRLWSVYYFDIALASLLLVGLADPDVPRIREPADVPYYVFLERLISWHFGPPPIVRKIVQHLTA